MRHNHRFSGRKPDRSENFFPVDASEILLEPLSPPTRGIAELEYLIKQYEFFCGQKSRLQKLGEALSEILPTLEPVELELERTQEALALEKEKLIALYAGELGRTSFAGLESGELPEYPVFTDRLDLQWRIESLERQRDKLKATHGISISRRAQHLIQQLKLDYRIRKEKSLIKSTNESLGEEIMIAGENWSFDCSQTAAVLPAIDEQKKRIVDLRDQITKIQQKLGDLRLTAAQKLGRPEVLETAALKEELEQTRRNYLENRSEIDAYRTLILHQISKRQAAGDKISLDPDWDQKGAGDQTALPHWLELTGKSPFHSLTQLDWRKRIPLIAGIAVATLLLLFAGIYRPFKVTPAEQRITQANLVSPVAEPEVPPAKLPIRQTNGCKVDPPASANPLTAGATQEITNSIGMRLTLIPGGTFTMGGGANEEGFQDVEQQHSVTLTQDYWLGSFEITQAQYLQVMGTNPSRFQGEIVGQRHPLTGNLIKEIDTSNYPVEQVSWFDAVEFCQRLSELPEEKQAGRVYRLPTEAEWEYACRAGSQTAFGCGDTNSELYDHGWVGGNSSRKTHPVGQKKPNAWGLYDMHGNVMEWCLDNFGAYPKGPVADPVGLGDAMLRVRRGGAWCDIGAMCRSAHRDSSIPSQRSFDTGFRVAVSLSRELGDKLAQ